MINKRLIYVSLSLIVTSLAVTAYLTWYGTCRHRCYTIGLVYVPSRSFHEYLNTALIKLIKKDSRFIIKEFTAAASSDLGLITPICNEALDSKVDLLITTGIHCAKAAIVTTQKRLSKKPVIFMGIIDAIRYGFVESLPLSGTNVTGVESGSPFDLNFNPADLLLAIKPAAAKVLIPYGDFTPEALGKYAENIQKKYRKTAVSITLLPIHNNNETLPRTAGLVSGHDSILYLEGDAIGVCGPGLGKLASQHNVTMLAGTIDGIKDAALSYVADPACLANMAFDLAKEILLNKKDPGTLPIVQAQVPRNLMINTKLCKEQDLADIDIPAVVNRIRSNPQLAAVHNHIIVDGVAYT